MTFDETVFAGCNGGFPPIGLQRVRVHGPAPSGPLSAAAGVTGRTIYIYWDAGVSKWRCDVVLGAQTATGLFTWDAANAEFRCVASYTCGGASRREYAVTWIPEGFASAAVNRSYVDEACDGGAGVLSWDSPLLMLQGAVGVSTDRTTGSWSAPPRAGPFSRVGTSALPRAGGQRMRFVF